MPSEHGSAPEQVMGHVEGSRNARTVGTILVTFVTLIGVVPVACISALLALSIDEFRTYSQNIAEHGEIARAHASEAQTSIWMWVILLGITCAVAMSVGTMVAGRTDLPVGRIALVVGMVLLATAVVLVAFIQLLL